MGAEHQINFEMTNLHKTTIRQLLTSHPLFYKTETIGDNEVFEFRKPNVNYDMPDFIITMEKDGLYICNNQHSIEWADIEFIKQYLVNNELKYKIKEL